MSAVPAATDIQHNNNTACSDKVAEQQQQQPASGCDSGQNGSNGSVQSSPGQLNASVDSGIAMVNTQALKLRQHLQQYQRILQVLKRNQGAHQLLRDRLSKIVDSKTKKAVAAEENNCNVCCAELDTSNAKNYVTCCTCGKFVCRSIKCADWLPKNAQWECELCHTSKESMAQTSSWVAEQMSFNEHKFVYPMRARSEIYIPINECNDSTMHFESVSQIGANSVAIMNANDRTKIREYVEEIVAEMLGGTMDHVKVGQLSKSENYLPAIINGQHVTNNNNNNNNERIDPNGNSDFADLSQTRLRTLIETIIAETLRSSNGFSTSGAVSEVSLDTRSNSQPPNCNGNGISNRRHRTEHYFEPKIYQDLLATAVLNKITDTEGNSRLISESTPNLSAHNIDENYNAEALSTSGSSIEPRSDCSLTDNELVLNAALERESVLSDYIAAHMVPLPDLSASVTESEDEIGSMSSSMIGDGNWEDNWLFKKKRNTIQSSATTSSIGMLVPAPKENVRAQIGDKTADEVSDLSEIGSDADESSLDLLRCNELNDRLLSKHLIGGQNTKLVLDELEDRTSFISNTLATENEPKFTETSNTLVVKPLLVTEMENQPMDTLIAPPPPMCFQDDIGSEEAAQSPIAGSIAEREVKKWYNAVEMPNNPYAPEALKQRISGNQERCMDVPNISPSAEQKAIALMTNASSEDAQAHNREADYKRYSRDYYINDAPATSPSSKGKVVDDANSEQRSSCTDDEIVINEVNQPQQPHGRITSTAKSNVADVSHWTLSTPVRRSSSLKFINKRTTPTLTAYERASTAERPSTSTSHYRDANFGLDYDEFDVRSQRSWRSSTAHSTLAKRRTYSTQSLHSNGSGLSFGSSASKKCQIPSAGILAQFEKQLLHKDLKRNSFRAVSSTSKDFVMNPLFETDPTPKLTLKSETHDQIDVDSGVDSCLNGFSGSDAKYSNNSLLF